MTTDATFPATLFDYNGVLIDDEHVHLAAFQRVLASLGVTLTEAAYWERYLGFDDVGAFRAILTDVGKEPDDRQIAELVEAKRPVYLELAANGLRPFAGAATLVRGRAACGPVGIVSGALRDEIALGLRVLAVADCVGQVIAAEDASDSKPSPAGYLMGIEWLTPLIGAVRARRALVIEDSVAGVQAAKAAGLPCCAVTHSYPRSELEAAGADAVFESIAEIDEHALRGVYQRLHG
jgi:beta-phosphoglucomutase-like phosphatase (HAD superfamily)